MKCNFAIPNDADTRSATFLHSSLTPRVILSIIITSLICFIATWRLPGDGLAPEMVTQIQDDYILAVAAFAPEPRERAAYLTALFMLPILIAALTMMAWRIGKVAANPSWVWRFCLHRSWNTFERWWLPTLLIITLTFARETPFGVTFGFFQYSIIQDVIHSGYSVLFFAQALLLAWIAYTAYYRKPPTPLVCRVADFAMIAGILYIAGRLSFIPETIGADTYSPSLIHIAPIFEPAVSAYLSTATVAINLVSQYGGVVEFARPFLTAASGDPSGLFWFAFFALATSLICIWLAIRRLLSGNGTLALIATMGVLYLTGIKSQQFACFQCANFRWVWPSLFLLLAAFDVSERVGWRWLPYFFLPFAIYWNPETGLACMVAWVGWRCIAHLVQFVSVSAIPHWARDQASDFLKAWLIFFAGAAILVLYLYYKVGAVPDFALLFQYAQDFYQLGFNMIPMPSLHLWNVYALLAIALFSIGVQYRLSHPDSTNEQTAKNCGFIIFSTLLFGLLFVYYQGRSYYNSLLAVSYPLWLAMVAWLGMGSATATAPTLSTCFRMAPRQSLLIAVLCLSASALVITPFYLQSTPTPYRQQDPEGKIAFRAFIQRTSDGKRPFFVSFSAWRLALLSGQSAGTDITPLAAMFRRQQLETYLNMLGATDRSVYYDRATEKTLQMQTDRGHHPLQPILDELHRRFIMENIPPSDVFDGSQGHIIRVRPKG